MAPERPIFLEPRLRLFLGADIVGSTALKQARLGKNQSPLEQAERGPAWFSAIQGFYFEASQAFLLEWDRAKAESTSPNELYGPDPTLWKTIGDEVLFVKIVTDHRQILITIQCWIIALKRMKDFLSQESGLLNVKSTAWTAGFPYRNREVVLEQRASQTEDRIENYYKENGRLLNSHYNEPSESKLAVDYIGPSIDTGFRLSAYATGRKFIVSVDTAYLISMTQIDGEIRRHDLYYDDAVTLKGVMGGSNYPLFWLDMSTDDSLARKEDRLKTMAPCASQDLSDYCDAFYRTHDPYTFRPFIYNDPGQTLGRKPSWYEDYLCLLVKNFQTPDSDYTADDSVEAQRPGRDINETDIENVLSQLSSEEEPDQQG